MQIIKTKFLAPTNTKGSRIRVFTENTSRIYSWDYALDVTENHTEALKHFAQSKNWLKSGDSLAIASDSKSYYAIILDGNIVKVD